MICKLLIHKLLTHFDAMHPPHAHSDLLLLSTPFHLPTQVALGEHKGDLGSQDQPGSLEWMDHYTPILHALFAGGFSGLVSAAKSVGSIVSSRVMVHFFPVPYSVR
jgi:hypothetical protein